MQYKTSLARRTFRHTLWYVTLCLLLTFSIALGIFTASTPRTATAATSSTMNFQARLLNSSGGIVPDGYYNVQFKVYNVATGGTAEWTETYQQSNRVRVLNGYLTVNLGSITSFPNTINWDQEHWLTMNIGGTTNTASPSWDGEMTPRLKLTAVPYAFTAGKLQQTNGVNQSTLGFATQTASRNILLPDESGTVCIQGSTNCGFVTGSAGNFIQNGTSPQTANFNVTGNGAIGGALSVGGNLTFTGSNAAIINRSASAASNAILVTRVSTDSYDRFRIEADGRMYWGSGNNPTMDTTLWRSGEGNLQTGGTFMSGGTMYAGGAGLSLTAPGGSILKTYGTSGSVTQNDVVILVSDSGGKVATSTTPRDSRVVGVYRGNSGSGSGSVTIAGDAQVNATSPAINVGDQLVVSSEAGKVMVDNNATSGVLGYAINFKALGGSTVMVRLSVVNGNTNPYYRVNEFRVQDAAGTTDLFRIDGANNRIAVGPASVPANGVLTVGANTTDAAGGLWFGTDTRLFRSGDETLSTSGNLTVGSSGSVCTSVKLCVNTTQVGARINVTTTNDSLQLSNSGANVASFSYQGKLKVAGATTYAGAINIGTNSDVAASGGIYFGTDVNLYRSLIGSTPVLMSNNGIALGLSAGSNIAFQAHVTGNAHPRFQVLATGEMRWGTGTSSYDIRLYKNGEGQLQTDTRFVAQTYVANGGLYTAHDNSGTNVEFRSGTRDTAGNTGNAIFRSGSNSSTGNTGSVLLQSGNASGGNSGTVSIDSGTASGTAGLVSVGATNASGVVLGRSGATVSVKGATTFDQNIVVQGTGVSTFAGALTVSGATTLNGGLTVSGSQFTNNASTVNTALALGNFTSGGSIGSATSTVDIKTSIAIAQTTAGQTLSLPSPTSTTAGRILYIFNTGSATFTMHGVSIPGGYGQIYIWNGSSWILGASGGGNAITLQSAYDGGNTINTSDAKNISFTLANTATDADFLVNIENGSTGVFRIRSNGNDVLRMGSTGLLNLSVQGDTGGILIGEDAKLYRSGSQVLSTSGAFTAYHNTVDQIALGRIAGSTPGAGITFGAAQDTNLYRSAANVLATDDSFSILGTGSNLYVQGTGTSTFDGTLTVNGDINVRDFNRVRATTFLNTAYSSMPTALAQSPMARSWHDIFAFNRMNGTPTFEQSPDGSTWNVATLNSQVFAQTEATNISILDGVSNTSARYTWNSGNLGWATNSWGWLVAKVPYTSSVAATKTILVESSADGITWTSRANVSGIGTQQQTIYMPVQSWSSHTRLRVTITSTNGQSVLLSGLQMLTDRVASQGGGREYEIPYAWDANMNLITQGSGGATGALRIGATNTTTADKGIYFGNDVNLYRSGDNVLSTDDTFNIQGGELRIGGTSVISASRVLQNVTVDAGLINSGVFADARLSANVMLLDSNQTITGVKTFNNTVNISGSNSITLGGDVSLSRTASNVLGLATGDWLNIVSGNLQFGGTSVITSGRVLQNVSANADIITAGTLADARLNTRLGTVSATITDWDSAITNGWYMGNGATNAPSPTGWFMGQVEAHNSRWITQTVHAFTSDSSTNTQTWRRSSTDASGVTQWGAWYKVQLSQAEQDARYAQISTLDANYIKLQPATPGTAQTGHINISGSVVAGSLNITGTGNSNFAGSLSVRGGGMNVVGYTTTGTSNLHNGQYTKLGSCTLVSQYGDCRSVVTIVSSQDGNATGSRATVDFRVKQQNPMGGAPFVNIDVTDVSGNIFASNFVGVTTVNDAGSTVVELYGQVNASYQVWRINPLINTAEQVLWVSGQPFTPTLPAGTQTTASYYNVVANNINAAAGNIQTGGTTRITNTGALQNVTMDAALITSGVLASARLSGTYSDITGVGALTVGSIGSGFGNINIGTNTFTGNGSGLTNLDATQLTGTINDARLSSNVALKNINNNFTTSQTVTGTVTATEFVGGGSGLTNLGADKITSGKLNDARLNDTVAMLNRNNQVFMGNDQTFRNGTNSTSAFRIQNSGSETLFNADTTNQKITVGGGVGSSARLHVNGGGLSSPATWTSQVATGNDDSWYSIVRGNNTYVAVGSGPSDYVMTSPDGITWTSQLAAENNSWFDVTYGNGIFVAVAINGTNRVMTSPDGITWTSQLVETNEWRGVTYGNGMFVAVAGSGTNRVMTSPDGITWTSNTALAGSSMWSVSYVNGHFTVVNTSGGVYTSLDGVAWGYLGGTGGSNWQSITYANGRYVAVTYSGSDNVATSIDGGVTWSHQTVSGSWREVSYINGLFVATASDGFVMTSIDGIAWNRVNGGVVSGSWWGVAGVDGSLVVVGTGGANRVITSTGGYSTAIRTDGSLDVLGEIKIQGVTRITASGRLQNATADASILTSGKLSDARLSSNVMQLTGNQTITGIKTFNSTLTISGSNAISLGGDVSLSRTTANVLGLATGDSLNLINGNLQSGGTTVLTSARVLQNVTANAGIITSGTFTDSLLSSNVALLNRNSQTFTGNNQLFRNASNSTTALQVQNAANGNVFSVDTTNTRVVIGTTSASSLSGANLVVTNAEVQTTIRIGDGTNGIDISGSTGVSYNGTARKTKKVILTPEYAGAVLDGTGVGTMTAGYDSLRRENYYKWQDANNGSPQAYDIIITVPVPSDWGAWAPSNALSVNVKNSTYASTDVTVIGTTGVTDVSSAGGGPGSSWQTINANLTNIRYNADGTMTIKLSMGSNLGDSTLVGNVTLTYLSKF